MDIPLKNIYTFEALSSNIMKLETEDDDCIMDVPLKNIYTFEALPSNMKLETEDDCVSMDKGTIKGGTKNFITCKSINNSLNDGIISENSSECNCAYGDVTIENLIENISSENKLLEQKGEKLDYNGRTFKEYLHI
ncbi:uncharacterized protein LOC142330326 isoform X2 [Lycorma delicatula]|uniref:uncharacterized protein LOC142330326 isoform X2 n=1 Tax=Lycorma delicatula TaxID=130591 RepID=UPI003F5181B7